ncbi:MAG: GDP-mannose 4,6-dehydratase [Opitutaceae bacterium]|nr:GDP-mannose 4,6-dehydratase [Cytophagales bacterium]
MSLSFLITGVAGFLGSHLSEALLELGHSVTGIDNFDPFYNENIKRRNLNNSLTYSLFTFIKADITVQSDLEKISGNFDFVIHIAAKAGVLPSIKNPLDYVSVNITGTMNVLEFMKSRSIKKYVFASSSSIYGNNKEVPFKEDQKVDGPISPYAFSKRSCELMNYTYHTLYNISCLNLRLFTLYGPRQRPDLSIHKFTRLIESGQAIEMYGDGSTARDYTHVTDVVNGFISAINFVSSHEKVYEIINIGNRNPVKLKDLIKTIYESLKVEPNIIQLPEQPGDVDITYADISKAKILLDYNPKMNFSDGIKGFVSWYEENKDFLK